MRKYHPSGALPRLPVYGPAGAGARMARAYDIPDPEGMSAEFDFREYPEETFQLGPFEIFACKVDHPVAAYGLRVSADGRTLAYTGDTGLCSSVVDVSKGVDLLLAEASFVEDGSNPPAVHLTGREAAQVATDAGVGRLVVTHVPPWYTREQVFTETVSHFDGDLSMATPGATYDV